jgi:hypothetical protein
MNTNVAMRVILRRMALVLIALASLAGGAEQEAPMDPMVMELLAAVGETDTLALAERVSSLPDARRAANIFSDLVVALYDRRDLPRMIVVGRSGIDFCVLRGRSVAGQDALAANELLGAAKTIAYNIAANTWPGWDDAGTALDATGLAIGLDAARINLRLARELARPSGKMSQAHWLLGAQLLAAHDLESAKRSFSDAAAAAEAGKAADERELANGCLAMAAMLQGGPRDEFQKAVDAFRARGDDDGKFYAQQLETALKVFSTAPESVSPGK